MFTAILLALAGSATGVSQEPIVIADDQPRIEISLAQYDLSRVDEVRKLKHRISSAAMTVCDRSYRGMSYLENVECVKTAVSAASSQLESALSKRGAGLAMTSIAVGAPRP